MWRSTSDGRTRSAQPLTVLEPLATEREALPTLQRAKTLLGDNKAQLKPVLKRTAHRSRKQTNRH